METKIFKPDEVEAAAKLLKQGELVAFPTETVYGRRRCHQRTSSQQRLCGKGSVPVIIH